MNIYDIQRTDIIDLFNDGIAAVHPNVLIERALSFKNGELILSDYKDNSEKINLNNYKNIIVIGAGKASAAMAKRLEELFALNRNDIKLSGVIVTKYGFGESLKNIEVIEAGHPLPDDNGIAAAKIIIEICKKATEKDLIINLLSGGASALLPAPIKEISLLEKIEVTDQLLKCGASIDEINLIRKNLSLIKGGKLLNYSYPARVVSLIISDVVGDRLDIIGSGITVPDIPSYKTSLKIIYKYKLEKVLPNSVLNYLKQNSRNEKAKKDVPDSAEQNATNLIIGNNLLALNKIKSVAEKKGYVTTIVNSKLEGEASIVVDDIIKSALKFIDEKSETNRKYCFLYGGETSVTIKGNGKGGRNQELALAAAIKLDATKGITFLSGGTDGNDGATDAAGAVCNGATITLGNKLGLNAKEYLVRNDSYNYFKVLNLLLITGPTGTNVMDIQIVLINKTA